MLTLHDIACRKGERLLFRGVQCTLERGAWLHVAGANGRGKTSLLRIVCGLSPAAAGEVRWGGQPIGKLREAFRRELLYVGHDSGLQPMLNARENLATSAALSGLKLGAEAIDQALATMGLAGREDLPTRFLSQGQKRRVALARLVFSPASLWVLDEPFVAMDKHALGVLAGLIAAHLGRGGLAVLTSHQAMDIGGMAPQVLELGA
jgi:heme exporter protein A